MQREASVSDSAADDAHDVVVATDANSSSRHVDTGSSNDDDVPWLREALVASLTSVLLHTSRRRHDNDDSSNSDTTATRGHAAHVDDGATDNATAALMQSLLLHGSVFCVCQAACRAGVTWTACSQALTRALHAVAHTRSDDDDKSGYSGCCCCCCTHATTAAAADDTGRRSGSTTTTTSAVAMAAAAPRQHEASRLPPSHASAAMTTTTTAAAAPPHATTMPPSTSATTTLPSRHAPSSSSPSSLHAVVHSACVQLGMLLGVTATRTRALAGAADAAHGAAAASAATTTMTRACALRGGSDGACAVRVTPCVVAAVCRAIATLACGAADVVHERVYDEELAHVMAQRTRTTTTSRSNSTEGEAAMTVEDDDAVARAAATTAATRKRPRHTRAAAMPSTTAPQSNGNSSSSNGDNDNNDDDDAVVWLRVDDKASDAAAEALVLAPRARLLSHIVHTPVPSSLTHKHSSSTAATAAILNEVGVLLACISRACSGRTAIDESAWRYGRNRVTVAAVSTIYTRTPHAATHSRRSGRDEGGDDATDEATATARESLMALAVYAHESGLLYTRTRDVYAMDVTTRERW